MAKSALDYAKQGSETLMRKFTVEQLPPAKRFHYHQGVYLAGVQRTYALSGEKKLGDYVKAWIDYYVDAEGAINNADMNQFDDIQPAILMFDLYKETGDERYCKALDSIMPYIKKWPKNAHGGFWHKFHRENQMWLDTLYMIGPLCTRYATAFDKENYLLEVIYQNMELMRKNMTDPKTGLLYHAWDDSKVIEWADPKTGTSSQFWGRAIGWYAVSIADILEWLPMDHPRRNDYINAERDIVNALIRFQDEKSGLWYQVVDRGDDPKNWHETSCSSLYTYAISKSIKMGILDKAYIKYAKKGYEGVVATLDFEGEDLILSNVCIGTGVGDYEFYLNRPTVQNDLHGMGAFLLMCTEYHDTITQLGL